MSGLFTFLLIVQALVALGLITVILMQRSEGGGLAGGGSPAGMMSARGASDFLTRGTSILATIFICLSILLAGLAAGQRGTGQIQGNLRAGARPSGRHARPGPEGRPGAGCDACPRAPAGPRGQPHQHPRPVRPGRRRPRQPSRANKPDSTACRTAPGSPRR